MKSAAVLTSPAYIEMLFKYEVGVRYLRCAACLLACSKYAAHNDESRLKHWIHQVKRGGW